MHHTSASVVCIAVAGTLTSRCPYGCGQVGERHGGGEAHSPIFGLPTELHGAALDNTTMVPLR